MSTNIHSVKSYAPLNFVAKFFSARLSDVITPKIKINVSYMDISPRCKHEYDEKKNQSECKQNQNCV